MTKILVIEDQEALREEILEILSLERFQAMGAENGRVGLSLVQEAKPDLILCDVMMPVLDGYGVLTALRQNPATATIPFIFLTAKSDKPDLRQGMKLGADDYLTKPFSRKDLLEAIASQFRKQAAIETKIQQRVEGLRSSISLALPHELHTPLTAIIGMSELLIEDHGILEPSDSLEMLETIHISAERLYRLTQNFLLYAELELVMSDPKRVETFRQSLSSCAAANTLTEVASLKAEQLGRSQDLQLELEVAQAHISELKFRKIIEEIIDNAFKFSQAGTLVAITLANHDDELIVRVTNHGWGMTDEQIQAIGGYMQFERRLHEQQGNGLGLIIAKRLAELYGGNLSIESMPNQTTTVQVILRTTNQVDC